MSKHLMVLFTFALAAGGASAATYAVDPAASKLTVHTSKAGLFKGAAHTHEIAATQLSGEVQADPARPRDARVRLVVAAAGLKVLDPEASGKDRAEIQRTMEGDRTLDIARFADIKYISRSVQSEPAGPGQFKIVIDGVLQLHGIQQAVKVPALVTLSGDRLTAKGEVQIGQKDFGITPFKAGLGTVRVKNEVQIVFEISARRTSK